jgi:hypothetical protein
VAAYTTDAGTPVIETTPDEYRDFLEREVRASLDISVDEFKARVARGEVDWSDPDVFYVASILGMGQNGR